MCYVLLSLVALSGNVIRGRQSEKDNHRNDPFNGSRWKLRDKLNSPGWKPFYRCTLFSTALYHDNDDIVAESAAPGYYIRNHYLCFLRLMYRRDTFNDNNEIYDNERLIREDRFENVVRIEAPRRCIIVDNSEQRGNSSDWNCPTAHCGAAQWIKSKKYEGSYQYPGKKDA